MSFISKKFQGKSQAKFTKNNFTKSAPPAPSIEKNQIWLYGKHPVFMALQKKKRQIFRILVTKNQQAELLDFIAKNNIEINKKLISVVEAEDIAVIFPSKVVHQGFAMLCSLLKFIGDNELLARLAKEGVTKKHIIVLDQLTDPHNVGAIIRSSSAFGIENIVFLKQTFNGENATICKSSSGAIENVNLIMAGNLNQFIEKLKELNYWVIGLDGSGSDDISVIRKYENICLVIGSEGDGIRQLVKRNCDLLLKIPISSEVESLNASNAAAIALFELTRK